MLPCASAQAACSLSTVRRIRNSPRFAASAERSTDSRMGGEETAGRIERVAHAGETARGETCRKRPGGRRGSRRAAVCSSFRPRRGRPAACVAAMPSAAANAASSSCSRYAPAAAAPSGPATAVGWNGVSSTPLPTIAADAARRLNAGDERAQRRVARRRRPFGEREHRRPDRRRRVTVQHPVRIRKIERVAGRRRSPAPRFGPTFVRRVPTRLHGASGARTISGSSSSTAGSCVPAIAQPNQSKMQHSAIVRTSAGNSPLASARTSATNSEITPIGWSGRLRSSGDGRTPSPKTVSGASVRRVRSPARATLRRDRSSGPARGPGARFRPI